MPKISIIVPAYNAEKYIDNCFNSLKKQTFQDFEVIVVNDGSKDRTKEKLETYENDKDISVTILNQENSGQAVARNHALKKATGDYIMFLDIDDTIEPTMLEEMMEKVETENVNADLVWCHMNRVENDKKEEIPLEVYGVEDNKKDFILNNSGPCAKLIKKSIILDHNLYFLEYHIYEDIAVVPAYALYASNIVHLSKPFYNYMMYPGSTMHQQTYHKKLEDIFVSMENLSKIFMNTEYTEELEFLYIKHLLHAASLRFFGFKEGKDALIKIVSIMKEKYPKWNKNRYYKKRSMKFKIVCELFYHKQYWLLRLLLK